jgi:hypothetical protein
MRLPCLLVSLSLLVACSETKNPSPEPVTQPEAVVSGLTYSADVAPLLREHCSACHGEGGIAPLALSTYEQVKNFGERIKQATAARIMPPFLPDNSGKCGTYFDANWLTDAEIALIGDWVDGGMAEGEPAEALEPVTFAALDDATHEAQMATPYLPDDTLGDDYRCFLLEDDFTGSATGYLTEFEVVPGDKRVVHHVVVYQPRNAAGAEQARSMDAADARMGYACFGSSGVTGARMLMNWAPGGGVVKHPQGTGVPVEPNLPIVMQVHYNTAAGVFEDKTHIRMKLAAEVRHPMTPWFYSDAQLALAPGQEEAEKVITTPFATVRSFSGETGTGPMTIMGVRAHMHMLGAKMEISRIAASGEQACLLDIPRYNFHWQRSYFMHEPISLDPADSLRVRCVFDTRKRTTMTNWGEGTSDEMCLATIYTIDGPYTP